MKKVFFDLDGVLADWEAGFIDVTGIMLEEFNSKTKQQRDEIKKVFLNKAFYMGLKPIEMGFKNLRSYIDAGVPVAILTSVGEHASEECAEAKKIWLESMVGEEVMKKIEFLWVTTSEDKAKYAQPGYVLIDDRMKAIEPWVTAGGVGFQFIDNEYKRV